MAAVDGRGLVRLAGTGDDLPSGWFAWIPHFDKGVHFGFYAGEMALLLLLFNPPTWRRGGVLLLVIAASALIEYLQGAYFAARMTGGDMLANAVGALCGLLIAPLLHVGSPAGKLVSVPTIRRRTFHRSEKRSIGLNIKIFKILLLLFGNNKILCLSLWRFREEGLFLAQSGRTPGGPAAEKKKQKRCIT